MTRSLIIFGINKIDVSFCLSSNISALLSKRHFQSKMSRTSFRVNPNSIVCLNVKERLARSRRHIWLIDSIGTWTHNHLVCKRTLNHLAKLAKWLSCAVSSYLYGGFDCILLLSSGCGFESRCYHSHLRYGACFEQGVSWYSGKTTEWVSLWNSYVTW